MSDPELERERERAKIDRDRGRADAELSGQPLGWVSVLGSLSDSYKEGYSEGLRSRESRDRQSKQPAQERRDWSAPTALQFIVVGLLFAFVVPRIIWIIWSNVDPSASPIVQIVIFAVFVLLSDGAFYRAFPVKAIFLLIVLFVWSLVWYGVFTSIFSEVFDSPKFSNWPGEATSWAAGALTIILLAIRFLAHIVWLRNQAR